MRPGRQIMLRESSESFSCVMMLRYRARVIRASGQSFFSTAVYCSLSLSRTGVLTDCVKVDWRMITGLERGLGFGLGTSDWVGGKEGWRNWFG